MLKDTLRNATIKELEERLDINTLDIYARANKEILSFLYKKEIIDDGSIESALEVAVLRKARQDYEVITTKEKPYIIYADHIGKPECLAYALDKSEFFKKEIKKIPFDSDHGDTAETFPQKYRKENLLAILRKELLNPRPLPKIKGK